MSRLRDWGNYRRAARLATAARSDQERIRACPKCGTLVNRNRAGLADCPLGHWRSVAADPRWEDYTPG